MALKCADWRIFLEYPRFGDAGLKRKFFSGSVIGDADGMRLQSLEPPFLFENRETVPRHR
jgi:hypothetical protein